MQNSNYATSWVFSSSSQFELRWMGWHYKLDWAKAKMVQCVSYFYTPLIFLEIRVIIKNVEKSLLSYKCWLIFIWMKQNKKNQNGRLIFDKISWIGPWVGRIDRCEGHWCGSTYIVVRLSDISSKTGKKCILGVFRLFWLLGQTASRLP